MNQLRYQTYTFLFLTPLLSHFYLRDGQRDMNSCDPTLNRLQSLPLDISLQIWVLLPITIATLLAAILRRNLGPTFLREPLTTISKASASSNLTRSGILRRNSGYISAKQFEVRRYHLVQENGPLDVPPNPHSAMSSLMNPDTLSNQATSIATSIVPQMLLGQWASSSFAGLVVCRLPFTLTPRFRTMLQSGIESVGRNLDISYVSSLSWFVLNIFGVSELLILFTQSQNESVPVIPPSPMQLVDSFNTGKAFSAEREALVSLKHEFVLHKEHKKFVSTSPDRFGLR